MTFAFVYDPDQNQANLRDRGIALEEAQQVWLDPRRVEFAIQTEDEPRHFAVGKVADGSYITVSYVPTPEKIRLLSARKSLSQEIQFYES